MKKTGTISFVVGVLGWAILSSVCSGYSGGDGSADNPYQIAGTTDLLELAADPNNYVKHFLLTADIDLSGETFTQAVIAPDIDNTEWSDFQGTQFTGVFDGNGKKISNLTITGIDMDYVGLFGCIGSGGQIKNLVVVNVDIQGRSCIGGLVGANYGTISFCYATGAVSGTGSSVGGLVGGNIGTLIRSYATSSVSGDQSVGGLAGYNIGTIHFCYTNGPVTGNDGVGGLAGYNNGTMISSYATGSVSGTYYVGGLVGVTYNFSFTSCYATGAVSGYFSVGGLVGENYGSSLTACYASGSVSGIHDDDFVFSNSIGGLVGENSQGTIISCYTTGLVIGDQNVGGLIGKINDGTLISCYATGSVSGSQDRYSQSLGGLVGKNGNGALANCYATGSVNPTREYPYPLVVGGLVGSNSDGVITACFWDIQTSGLSDGVGNIDPDPTGVTGKTTVEMQTRSTFIFAGWDFTNEIANGTNDTWRMCVDGVYPRLNWESTQGDYACPDGVNIEDLDYFVGRWLLNDCTLPNNYCGGADMDISGTVNLEDYAILAGHWLEGI
jgi:hypothetical protein